MRSQTEDQHFAYSTKMPDSVFFKEWMVLLSEKVYMLLAKLERFIIDSNLNQVQLINLKLSLQISFLKVLKLESKGDWSILKHILKRGNETPLFYLLSNQGEKKISEDWLLLWSMCTLSGMANKSQRWLPANHCFRQNSECALLSEAHLDRLGDVCRLARISTALSKSWTCLLQ